MVLLHQGKRTNKKNFPKSSATRESAWFKESIMKIQNNDEHRITTPTASESDLKTFSVKQIEGRGHQEKFYVRSAVILVIKKPAVNPRKF